MFNQWIATTIDRVLIHVFARATENCYGRDRLLNSTVSVPCKYRSIYSGSIIYDFVDSGKTEELFEILSYEMWIDTLHAIGISKIEWETLFLFLTRKHHGKNQAAVDEVRVGRLAKYLLRHKTLKEELCLDLQNRLGTFIRSNADSLYKDNDSFATELGDIISMFRGETNAKGSSANRMPTDTLLELFTRSNDSALCRTVRGWIENRYGFIALSKRCSSIPVERLVIHSVESNTQHLISEGLEVIWESVPNHQEFADALNVIEADRAASLIRETAELVPDSIFGSNELFLKYWGNNEEFLREECDRLWKQFYEMEREIQDKLALFIRTKRTSFRDLSELSPTSLS